MAHRSEHYLPITKEKAAEILGVSKRTIENWVANGCMPAPQPAGGRRVYWHPDVLHRWLDGRLQRDTDGPIPSATRTPPVTAPVANTVAVAPRKPGRPRKALPPMLQHLQG